MNWLNPLPHPARMALAAMVLACFALTGCGRTATSEPGNATAHIITNAPPPNTSTASPAGIPAAATVQARVIRVIDGDTVEVSIDGRAYTLRYIGIDTPETVRPNYPVEWMGPEASAANKALVSGKTVYLEKDVSETDVNGRLLRYVYLADGTFVNAELVRQGYAHANTYPPDVKHQNVLQKMQREAAAARRGLWGPPPSATAPWTTQVPGGGSIIIVTVNKPAEYVDIQNAGRAAQDLAGWVLVSEKGDQRCSLGGVIEPGELLRIWTLAADTAREGYNCGFQKGIWNNFEPDPAVLYDAQGQEVARR